MGQTARFLLATDRADSGGAVLGLDLVVILFADYFGDKLEHADATLERQDNARDLLERVNRLLQQATNEGAYLEWLDDDTGTQISGSKGGYGDGGFRLQLATTGKPFSSHKQGRAVDVFDPHGRLDDWLTDETLEQFGLYREAPQATRGWCHLSTQAPGSGKRTFIP